MIELAKRMVDMSIYNPEYTYNSEIVKNYLLEKLKEDVPNSAECRKLYNEINERRPPLANRNLVHPFEIFTSLRSFEYVKFIKRYGLENVLLSRRYAIDLMEVCQLILNYEGENVAEDLAHEVLQDFLEVYSDESQIERMWDIAHRLQVIVVRGIAKGTVRRYQVENEINILKQLTEFKRQICHKVLGKEDIPDYENENLIMRLDLLNAENLFLEDYNLYKKEMTVLKQKYLDEDKIDLYNNLNAITQGIAFSANEKPPIVYTEYLELIVLNFKPEHLMYRSSSELSKTYEALKLYVDTFSDDNLKKHIITSLDEQGEGFVRYIEGTSQSKYLEKNLNLLAMYGVISPRELEEYKRRFLGGK